MSSERMSSERRKKKPPSPKVRVFEQKDEQKPGAQEDSNIKRSDDE